jgi:hypothetical protein
MFDESSIPKGSIIMKTIDRLLLGALSLGVWVLIFHELVDSPLYAQSDDVYAENVSGLADFIEGVVENCEVIGDVYLYSEEYGELDDGEISC